MDDETWELARAGRGEPPGVGEDEHGYARAEQLPPLAVLDAAAGADGAEWAGLRAWELLAAVAGFIRRRPAPGCGPEGPARMPRVWPEHACGELAVVLAVTGYHADWLLGLAHDLAVKLPLTSAALRGGVDVGKARVVAGGCPVLTVAEAGEAEALLFADRGVAAWTEPGLRDRVARAVMGVSPEAARQRRERRPGPVFRPAALRLRCGCGCGLRSRGGCRVRGGAGVRREGEPDGPAGHAAGAGGAARDHARRRAH